MIFENIKSYIPEDKQADVKAEVDGAVKELITQTKKDLSRRYGVNFFKDNVEEAFENENFVRSSIYEQVANEREELKKANEEYASKLSSIESEKEYYEIGIGLIKENFNVERLEAIKPLLVGEGSREEKVARIKNSLPELFLSEKSLSRTNPVEKEEKLLTDAEKYYAQRRAQFR